MGAQDGTPKTPDWAAQICDIPAQVIRDLADRISRTKTMIAMAWGMQRADRGEITLWAGLSLACLLADRTARHRIWIWLRLERNRRAAETLDRLALGAARPQPCA